MATAKELEAKIAELEATIEANKPEPKTMTIKVSETTGVIVVGGLTGRNPMSFYQNTWIALLTPENAGRVLDFIETHQPEIDKYMKAAGKKNR
jgi:hypothetical protein